MTRTRHMDIQSQTLFALCSCLEETVLSHTGGDWDRIVSQELLTDIARTAKANGER